ncbi:prolipoprotein diacylglyceryl transferase [Desulforhopalus vacuolatus]|uniref:prolipoprotein diacylglyceryl transferase n=1 Tax=Desulforhopalus vacuolatus TaxID=40414 RepID=UPI0019649C90|nr:prolipoprotein diacylglyceryl transferase [Desulforhopalus vacuolatus]MBM9519338.1 prolipoprotein diacylglyceryl transferase [Desulforhopalus vacuolatus]
MHYPQIDPAIFCLGPLCIRWYGLMYVLGFLATYYLVKLQIRQFHFTAFEKHFENLNAVLVIAVMLGGRLGYVLLYNWSYYCRHPLEILATWNGGMSFHGACFTVIVTGCLFCRWKKINFWKTADLYIVTVPIGLGLGRIGNFINGELYGRVTTSLPGMIFPDGGPLPRHPSQLYEAVLEGLLLFCILWTLRRRPWRGLPNWPHGSMLAFFLVGYGVFRIFIENFREPDVQIGFLFAHITMGQLLSSIMIAGGVLLWLLLRKVSKKTGEKDTAKSKNS